jgi:hypothetical protein
MFKTFVLVSHASAQVELGAEETYALTQITSFHSVIAFWGFVDHTFYLGSKTPNPSENSPQRMNIHQNEKLNY